MLKVGNMIWRIGELLDFDRQLAWIRDNGFDGVAFHATAGLQGKWCGVEPASCDAAERERLRQEIAQFSFSEIHAPFAIVLRRESLAADLASLTPVLEFAQDLGVGVITVHAEIPGVGEGGWLGPMRDLDAVAAEARIKIALEINGGFDEVLSWGLSNVGVNIDVGHMYLPEQRQMFEEMGGIGNIIRHIGDSLLHLHLHDFDGELDHIEIGTGIVAFDEIVSALQDIDYRYGATLELNPDRVTPEGICRSAEYIRRCCRGEGV